MCATCLVLPAGLSFDLSVGLGLRIPVVLLTAHKYY